MGSVSTISGFKSFWDIKFSSNWTYLKDTFCIEVFILFMYQYILMRRLSLNLYDSEIELELSNAYYTNHLGKVTKLYFEHHRCLYHDER